MVGAVRARFRAAQGSTIQRLQATVRRALDLLFPWQCLACGAPNDFLCPACSERIRWIREPLCEYCGLPFATGPARLCGHCQDRRPSFERARSTAIYGNLDDSDPLGAAIRALKYARRRPLAGPLAGLLARRCPYVRGEFDVIVPVPLHVSRLRERGFNQALLLARGPALALGVPIAATLVARVRPTAPQTTLDERARRQNVRDAFRVARPERAYGRRILLVDDVITSAATADACARTLLDAGAARVSVLSLARAIFH